MFALPIRVSIPLFRLSSLLNTTPRYLNAYTCCSVFPLTCRKHCLERLQRNNTSIFLVLIFVPVVSHAAENRSNACWRPCWDYPHMWYPTNLSAKITVFHAVPNSDTHVDVSVAVYPIHIDQRFSQFLGRRPHKLLHNSSRARHLTFYQISTFFIDILFFYYLQNLFWCRVK